MNLDFYAASAVIPSPSSPDGPPPRPDAHRASFRATAPAVRDQGFSILAARYDCCGAPGSDGVTAYAGVEGAVGGGAADLLIGRDPVEQLGQH